MSDEIKDMDDVEAQAWVTAFAAGVRWAESYPHRPPLFADECVRLLRARRANSRSEENTWPSIVDETRGATEERTKIATWLRNLSGYDKLAPCAGILLDLAVSIERGEHDHG